MISKFSDCMIGGTAPCGDSFVRIFEPPGESFGPRPSPPSAGAHIQRPDRLWYIHNSSSHAKIRVAVGDLGVAVMRPGAAGGQGTNGRAVC